MALLSQLFTALLLLHFGLHLVGGSQDETLKTTSCPVCTGIPGTPGHNGLPGRDGRDGKDGAVGPNGERGEPGLSVHGPPGKAGPGGPVGPAGPKGQKGDRGPPGPSVNGPPGKAGAQGPVGSAGPKGEKGVPGPSVNGSPGKAGVQGPVGPAGPKGQKGDPGAPGNVHTALITSLQSEVQALKAKVTVLDKVLRFSTLKKVGRKIFVMDSLKETFDDGLKFCTDAGGTLALPRNENENQVLTKMIVDLESPHVFVGATDRENEGTFVDVHKARLTFTNWKKGEPNNYKNAEHCATVYPTGEWNDFPCGTKANIICEIKN